LEIGSLVSADTFIPVVDDEATIKTIGIYFSDSISAVCAIGNIL
jgi:hypothetical protein